MSRMSTAQSAAPVVGGVDTHERTHHAAALSAVTGRFIGDREFPATLAGYRQLLAWLSSFGPIQRVGVEGTGSYGAGLTRFLHAQSVPVTEVARPDRSGRRAHGKSDPIDAIAAARAVLAATATAIPKERTGPVEVIRLLHTTRTSAVKARKQAINQIRSILHTAPDELRADLSGLPVTPLIDRCARLRPASNHDLPDITTATKTALRTLARRIRDLDTEIAATTAQLTTLVAATAPATLAITGAGVHTTAQLLITAGENLHRLHSEAALARICGVAPIPASSGTTTRHRLHRGGDRQANAALYLIVLNRLRWHQPTHTYVHRRTAQGKTKKDIIRCLKRALIREIYTALTTDLTTT